MPELPEVETIKRGLEKLITGFSIVDVEVRLPKMIKGDVQKVKGGVISRVRRRGKGLIIDLDNRYSLAIHVKMTGQLVFKGTVGTKETVEARIKNLHPVLGVTGDLPNKHTHVIFSVLSPDSGKAILYYNDIRQFGWIQVVPTAKVEQLPFFQSLGLEPLNNLTFERFQQLVQRAKLPIKIFLMHKKRLAGVGNIYANDALFQAGIHPLRPASSLTESEQQKLFDAVEYVLKEGIKAGGASEENFVNALGEKGFYQERFLVYKQTGKACKRCGTPIERIVIGGRGTFFCPSCQV